MPLDTIRTGEIYGKQSCKALIIAINSCIGCGERKLYPEAIRDAITKFMGTSSDKDFEDLDTPMFQTNNINTLADLIRSVDNKCIPIILTHHNLLTQNIPRIAMYTELINSGYMRDILISLDRPILYLHGHLHDDPVEIITSPRHKNSKIISISAPLLFPNTKYESIKFGFNKIKLVYSQDKTPIGCEIINNKFVSLTPEKTILRIRFWGPPDTMALTTRREKDLLKFIDKKMYLADLMENYNQESGQNSPIEEIEKLVNELDWLGLVE